MCYFQYVLDMVNIYLLDRGMLKVLFFPSDRLGNRQVFPEKDKRKLLSHGLSLPTHHQSDRSTPWFFVCHVKRLQLRFRQVQHIHPPRVSQQSLKDNSEAMHPRVHELFNAFHHAALFSTQHHPLDLSIQSTIPTRHLTTTSTSCLHRSSVCLQSLLCSWLLMALVGEILGSSCNQHLSTSQTFETRPSSSEPSSASGAVATGLLSALVAGIRTGVDMYVWTHSKRIECSKIHKKNTLGKLDQIVWVLLAVMSFVFPWGIHFGGICFVRSFSEWKLLFFNSLDLHRSQCALKLSTGHTNGSRQGRMGCGNCCSTASLKPKAGKKPLVSSIGYPSFYSQTLHVCHICLHWGGFRGQCMYINMPYMECLGLKSHFWVHSSTPESSPLVPSLQRLWPSRVIHGWSVKPVICWPKRDVTQADHRFCLGLLPAVAWHPPSQWVRTLLLGDWHPDRI